MNKPALRIGVTGGIGSGKSVVCRMFAMLGAYVYDSDAEAKRLMSCDQVIIEAVKSRFGTDVYKNGLLDRAVLAERVFSDKDALAALNAIVHPGVIRDFVKCSDAVAAPYIIVESAVLFESGLDKTVDVIVTVSAPEEWRVVRAASRDGVPLKKIRDRMANQMTDLQREAGADYILLNDERHLVWEQVLALDAAVRQKR